MRLFKTFLVFIIFGLTTQSFVLAQAQGLSWYPVKEKNGIMIFHRDKPNSKRKDLKAVVVLDHTQEEVLTALRSPGEASAWIHSLHQSQTEIAPTADDTGLYYFRWKLPWPFRYQEAYVVFEETPGSNGQPTEVLYTNDKKDRPKKQIGDEEVMQLKKFECLWLVNPVSENQTELSLMIEVAPKGKIPAWFIKIYLKRLAVKSLENFREFLPAA